jgi:hypothetical protein
MEFPFDKKLSKKFGEVFEPTIPVTVVGPKRAIEVLMLIDSGADISLLPASLAELIGLQLDMKNRREVYGLGEGGVPYVLSPVTLRIRDVEISARVAWALAEDVPLVLGRLDVFRRFAIEFREFENRVVLTERQESNLIS